MQKFAGIFPAVASPCDEADRFLEDKFAILVTDLYKADVQGLYICGGTGDGYKMRVDERMRATQIAVELSLESGGSTIVHVGAASTRDAVELAEHAAGAGADAISSIPPTNASQKELIGYYTDLAQASSLPVFIYYFPSRLAVAPSLPQLLQLLEIEGVVGLKLSDWNLFLLKRLLYARPDLMVFNGFDEFLYPGLLYGATGGIGTWYNLFPRVLVAIYRAFQAQDHTRALALQDCLLYFLDYAAVQGMLPIFEFLMQQRGYGPRYFRRPHEPLDLQVLVAIEPELNSRILAIENAL
jgi:dihydrodipicolinate synthase/N-acetylneuraminate lyase